jgi:protein-S-isoprenylcysteine O-methyltransferase Ste14
LELPLFLTQLERAFVWAGGAIFVASLAIFAWFYGVVWGRQRPFSDAAVLGFNAALFSAFALHHSLFARPGVKARLLAIIPERLLRSCYVWVASTLFITVLLVWRSVGGLLYTSSGSLAVAHAAVQLLGIWFIAGAVRAIDPLELAGIRQESSTTDLQTGGPYRIVRHPLYLGWMLVVFGAATMTGDRLALAVISSAYLFIAVPWEERELERAFGVAYVRYKQDVRWRILPFLY